MAKELFEAVGWLTIHQLTTADGDFVAMKLEVISQVGW